MANVSQQFRNIMQPASRQEAQKLVQHECRKITHSVYHDWEEVRKTAILILRHMGIFVREAQAEKTIHGVLINMNWVWEQYLQSILEDEIKEEYTSNHRMKERHSSEYQIKNHNVN